MVHKLDLLRMERALGLAIGFVFLVRVSFSGISLAKDTPVMALQGEPDDGFDPVMGWGRYGHHLFHSTLLPQFLVGLILLFPHAIMHTAGLTFLGFGLPPHMPAIGVLLSEAMRYISTGYRWQAVVSGLALLFFVKLFDLLGGAVRTLTAPRTSQE